MYLRSSANYKSLLTVCGSGNTNRACEDNHFWINRINNNFPGVVPVNTLNIISEHKGSRKWVRFYKKLLIGQTDPLDIILSDVTKNKNIADTSDLLVIEYLIENGADWRLFKDNPNHVVALDHLIANEKKMF